MSESSKNELVGDPSSVTSLCTASNLESISHNPVEIAIKRSSTDRGHRLGNFHNYYTFHPSTSRLDTLENNGVFDYVLGNTNSNMNHPVKRQKITNTKSSLDITKKCTTLRYCDLGCNEGDMTVGVAQRLLSISKKHCAPLSIQCLGLDIDNILIQRANRKIDDSGIRFEFQNCNVCNEKDHLSKCNQFLQKEKHAKFDFTTIFSTTMWIHVHAGDEGLHEFLKRACDMTNMLLVEPQSSKSYRSINKRLRKMNQPEIKYISDLKLRANIESEIQKIILRCGFEKIDLISVPPDGETRKKGWDRKLQLYRRT